MDTSRLTPITHALLRIVAGLLFIEHGTQKLLGFPPSAPGHPAPTVGSLLWIGGVLELVGGLLVLVGLFTRPVAFILAGEMAVAYWTFHAPQSTFPAINMGDAAILFCFVFLFLSTAGSGPWSVDEAIRQRRLSGRTA
ncbi:DoxX family protein [Sphingomonas ginkgonis]|uniref:DoxX family protein n=1 Tax=Sphingomonas ginkgonis TaxID=2315330 RepID=A0A429VAQ5_9SPHN|nr:DoxX family protein [Sphingomonas ginkgonis]RST31059.1 DoxX family protein [Sphingomonas ginkgonis]